MTRLPPSIPCPGCDAAYDISVPDRENRFLGTAPEDALLACVHCGLRYRRSLPDEAAASGAVADGRYRWSECTAGTRVASPRMRRRLAEFETRLGRPGRVLDIGCGTGTFLALAQERGWEAIGTDLRERREPALSSLRVVMTDLTTNDAPEILDGGFDLVHLSHVLEHTAVPTSLLDAALRKLRPGGWLCVEVPNELNSLAARIKMVFGRPYDSATARFRHRLFFTAGTLAQMVRQAGGVDIKVATPAVGEDLGWAHRTFDQLQSRIRMGAVLTCIARKPGI